jgi:hypothetical protein
MPATFLQGDVLARVRRDGTTEYVRVGGPDPSGQPRIYVHDCDETGHLTASSGGRYLLATTLATRYTHHATPSQETYR